jgi:hypothetical protein
MAKLAQRPPLTYLQGEYYAFSPRASIGLDETADALCEVSGIPNPMLFRVMLRKTIASLSAHPELVFTNGYHVMSW